MLTAMLGFAAASALIVMLPGPDTLVVVRNMLRGGRSGAIAAAAGVLAGLLVWVVAVSLGLSAIVTASHTGYMVLRYVGGAYLIWIGVQAVRSRMREGTELAPPPRSLLGSGFTAGFATDLLNPKVGVFFVSFLPAFVPQGTDVGTASLAFGAVFVLETLVYFALLIRVADRVVGWMTDARRRRLLDRLAGVVFIGFGIRLATEA